MNYDSTDDYAEIRDVFAINYGMDKRQRYGWIWEGISNQKDQTNEEIRELVDVYARILYSDYECAAEGFNEDNSEPIKILSLDEFKRESNYYHAIKALIEIRDEMQADFTLETIVTIDEVVSEYEISEKTVLDACERWMQNEYFGVRCRLSGSTYLMRLQDICTYLSSPDTEVCAGEEGKWTVTTPSHKATTWTMQDAWKIAVAYKHNPEKYDKLIQRFSGVAYPVQTP